MATKWTRSRLSDVVDISDRIRRGGTGMTTNAEEGSVAVSSIEVDDPEGDLEIANLHGIYGFETIAPTNQKCFYRGFVGDWSLGRGPMKRVGRQRRYVVEAGDQNSILSRRIFRPTDTSANRPAETDAARIAWLLGTPQMTHIEDDTYVNTAGAVALDKSDFRKQTPFDVLNDMSAQSGKNFWVMFQESGGSGGGTFGLWYDFDYSEAYRTDLRISNYPGDEDADTYYPFLDAELKRISQRIYSGMALDYDGGSVFVERDATGDAYQYRDTTAYAPNVKTSTKATARATRMLNSIATPEDRITCTIQVCRADVNRLREGHGVECRFSHLTGYEDWTWMRVLNRTVSDIATDDFYTIKVEMSAEPAAPPASCSTALSGSETSDSGEQTADSPLGFIPADPTTYPRVVLAVWGVIQTGTFLGGSGAISVDSPYTLMHEYSEAGEHVGFASGYTAVTSGSPGEFNPVWPGVDAGAWRTIAIAIATAETAPVQTASQGSGSTATLPAPPTPGNLLVVQRVYAPGHDQPFEGAPEDWTTIAQVRAWDGGVSDLVVYVFARCAGPDEDAEVIIGGSSFFKFATLSEWAIT